MKKLENYKKKESELSWWRKQAGPEDIDYFECQSELQQELVKSYNYVERIFGKYTFLVYGTENIELCILKYILFLAEQTREIEGGGTAHEYFCKWESLPYADATWEDSALIEKKWPENVQHFKAREAATSTPSRHCPVLRRRPKFHQLKEQPEYMGKDKVLLYFILVIIDFTTMTFSLYEYFVSVVYFKRLSNGWVKLVNTFLV